MSSIKHETAFIDDGAVIGVGLRVSHRAHVCGGAAKAIVFALICYVKRYR